MSPGKFQEIRNQISDLTPTQKQRLVAELQASVQHDELPEPIRRKEEELGPAARLHPLRRARSRASREVGRFAPFSLPLGVLRTHLSRVDRDASCETEAQVQMVPFRGVFAGSADVASIGGALWGLVSNGLPVAAPVS